MDLTLNLSSNTSGHIFPGNTLTSYQVMLQKYTEVDVPHASALTSITMPTKWYNLKHWELFLVQVEKEAPIPPDLFVPVEKKNGKRTTRSTMLRRGGKISKLCRLIETASKRYPVANMRKRIATTTPAVTIPKSATKPLLMSPMSSLENLEKKDRGPVQQR